MDLEAGTKVWTRISARGDAVNLTLEAPLPNVRAVSPQSCPGTTITVHLIDIATAHISWPLVGVPVNELVVIMEVVHGALQIDHPSSFLSHSKVEKFGETNPKQ